MDVDKETEKQIQELQVVEQNLQQILMQKQALTLELSEVDNAVEELKKTKDEVYKIVGQIMIKTNKKDLEKDLKEKQDLISMRVRSIDTQEKALTESGEKLRKKVLSKIQK